MSGFDDLIAAGLPYLATEHIKATANSTWQWDYLLTDDADALVDISTGFTLSATIATRSGTADAYTYTSLYAPTCSTPSTGKLRCVVTPATNTADPGGTYYHAVKVVRNSDSAAVIVVGGGDSKFSVKKKVA